jgi:hypothetical protein
VSDVLLTAMIGAIPATVAALAAWRAAKNSKPISNGFTTHVMEELGEIKGLM